MNNEIVNKKYRTIYITEPTHDFSLLARYCDQIKFLLTGNEKDLTTALSACKSRLTEFDPALDAIVAVGKVNSSFLAGIALKSLLEETTISLGVYVTTGYDNTRDKDIKDYRWEMVTL